MICFSIQKLIYEFKDRLTNERHLEADLIPKHDLLKLGDVQTIDCQQGRAS